MKNPLLIIAFFGILLISCQSPETQEETILDLDKVRVELQQMEDSYATGSNAKDAEAVLFYYGDDAMSLPTNEPTRVGKTAILEGLQKDFAADTSNTQIRFEVVDVYADGNLVVEVGRSISTDSEGNETMGKYISVFERRDGQLVCVRDIWNNDAPEKSVESEE